MLQAEAPRPPRPPPAPSFSNTSHPFLLWSTSYFCWLLPEALFQPPSPLLRGSPDTVLVIVLEERQK